MRLLLAFLLAGCGNSAGGSDSDSDADADADSDSDADSDADSDTDADADSDADADTDADADADSDADTDADTDADADTDTIDPCDADADGFDAVRCGGPDCDDADAGVGPDSADRFGDGLDVDCDGADGVDSDGDGSASTASGGDDCDDADARVYPGRPDEANVSTERPAGDEIIGWPALALDSSDEPHIAYHELVLLFGGGDSRGLRYATKDADDWSVETVQPADTESPTIAIDADDVPHVVWVEGQSLRHAYPDGGAWSDEEIDAAAMPDKPSIAFDSAGDLHVVYLDRADRSVRHAWQDGAGWSIEDVDLDAGSAVSLAIDADDVLHVAYEADGNIRYATDGDGGWTDELVDTPLLWPFGSFDWPSIAVSGDVVHIAYGGSAGFGGSELRHAWLEGGAWSTESLDTIDPSDSPAVPDIAIDTDGSVHLAYVWQVGSVLKAASNATDDGSWILGDIGWNVVNYLDRDFFALDSTGVAHAVYLGEIFGGWVSTYHTFATPNGRDDDCDGVEW